MARLKIRPGRPTPLGATLTPNGVNFAVFAPKATGLDICLFEHPGSTRESHRIALHERTDGVWHGLVPGLNAGQLYGLRAHGPYEPKKGLRFNPAKLLLDPYARAIAGDFQWGEELCGYVPGMEDADLHRDDRNSATRMPRSVVVNPLFDWGGETRPAVPLEDSVIYELHVRGFTRLCPGIPEALRGTYAALGSAAAIEHFKKLGVTAVELLPVHHFAHDEFLLNKGLSNYWGYNPIGFFAPHAGYSASGETGGQVAEFKAMVKALHQAGIEVILDVVFNHTAEGNHLGPTLCFRGLANQSYYVAVPESPRHLMDFTGCGNSLNVTQSSTLQFIADCLRYWAQEMHVDGFRFDLATTLGRERHGFDPEAGFFDILRQDPVLSALKLIAEPWDLGGFGYQVGAFPAGWSEWNGKYRDAVRAYWKGDENQIGEFAARLAGSADLYQAAGRRPTASINFVTAHDGFTLLDLVSYNEKHNEANGEDNRDGDNANRSWNCGVEGPTDDAAVLALRRRQQRNFLATLLLSQGVPMLCAGDEYGRTQLGNNNAYCQDNALSWMRWSRSEVEEALEAFTARLIALRAQHPIFRRPKYFTGRKARQHEFRDLVWLNVGGVEMRPCDWTNGFSRCLGAIFSGDLHDVQDEAGRPVADQTFMLLCNAHHEPLPFTLAGCTGTRWRLLLDTQLEEGFLSEPTLHKSGTELLLRDRSLCLLCLEHAPKRRKGRPRNRKHPAGAA